MSSNVEDIISTVEGYHKNFRYYLRSTDDMQHSIGGIPLINDCIPTHNYGTLTVLNILHATSPQQIYNDDDDYETGWMDATNQVKRIPSLSVWQAVTLIWN